MNLGKCKLEWWQLMLCVVVIAILSWITMSVWYAVKQPQLTGIEAARKAFIDNCSGTRTTSGWTNTSQQLVPTAVGDDASKWKCEVK